MSLPNKPLSFKDTIKPANPRKQNQVLYPNPQPLPDPKLVAKKAKQKQEYMAFINTERCPICKSQLDGGVYHTRADVSCVANPTHYMAHYTYPQTFPQSSTITLLFDTCGILVNTWVDDEGMIWNAAYQLDMGLNAAWRMKEKKLIAKFSGARYQPSQHLDERDLLEELEAYEIFS